MFRTIITIIGFIALTVGCLAPCWGAAAMVDIVRSGPFEVKLGVCDWTIGKTGDPAALAAGSAAPHASPARTPAANPSGSGSTGECAATPPGSCG